MTSQRGIALITAILVVALASIAATAILISANLAIHRTTTLLENERAGWIVTGIESWVKAILAEDRRDNAVDHLGEPWARPVDYLPVDDGVARGAVVDLQSRFNLNNLAAANPDKHVQQFNRLLALVAQLGEPAPPGFIESLLDWMDADSEPRFPAGAEDIAYLNLTPIPYRTAGRALAGVSELRAIQGMTPQFFAALRPHVCALPLATPVNVNTAGELVLRSLSDTPDEAKLAAFLRTRTDTPAENVQKLIDEATLGVGIDPALITVSSRYFGLQAQVFVGSGRANLYSSVFRPDSGAPVTLSRATDEP